MNSLTEYLAKNPADSEAQLLVAQTARRGGNPALALVQLKRIEWKQGTSPELALEYRLLKVSEGDQTEADALFTQYVERVDSRETYLVMEAYIEGRLKVLAPRSDSQMDAHLAEAAGVAKLHRAVDLWLQLRTGKADKVQGLVWRGRVFLFENDHAKGTLALREAVELDPDHAEARWHLAMAIAQESPTEVARHLEILLTGEPDSYLIRSALARTYRVLGRMADSRRMLEEMLAAQPNDVSLLLELANLYLDTGKVEEAGPLLTRARELSPDSLPVNLTASRYYQLAGQPTEAERYRKRGEQIQAEQQKKRESAVPK